MSPSNELIEVGSEALKLVGAGWTIQKLIGPTLDYVGEAGRQLVEKRIIVLKHILSSAAKRLGDPGQLPDGEVSPRVLRDIVLDASFVDDEVAAEYFGGILAADRLSSGDDRAATWSQLLTRLSTHTIRCHYVLYRAAHRCLRGSGLNFAGSPPGEGDGRVYVPSSDYAAGMELPSETHDEWDLWAEAMYMLQDEGLLNDKDHGGWSLLGVEPMRAKLPRAPEAGAVFLPSYRGVKLFVIAHGVTTGNRAFTETDLALEDLEVPMGTGSRRVSDLVEEAT